MKRYFALILALCLFVLSACANEQRTEENTEEPDPETVEVESIECTILGEERYSEDNYVLVWVSFLLPDEWSREAIRAHAREYCKERYARESHHDNLALAYYDTEYFYRFGDTPIAELDLRVNNMSMEPYMFSYSPRDTHYALTGEELDLYIRFQEAYYEETGRYASEHYSDSGVSVYEHKEYAAVAERLNVDADTLIDLRIKVTMYCMQEIPYCVVE